MTAEQIAHFKIILAEHGQHVTKARLATFKALISARPQSMREVLQAVGPAADRVSVYRSIELFERLGIAHRVYTGWKYKLELSDAFVAHHHHLTCLNCSRVIDIEDEAHIDEFIHELAERFGFTPRRHQFEIEGYCRECTEQ